MTADGIIAFCPDSMDSEFECPRKTRDNIDPICGECRREYWLEEVEEDELSLANHKLRADVKIGTKVRLKRDLNAASGILPKGAVAIIALKEDDELMLFFPDHLVNSDTKLLHIYRSEIGGNDYEVMTDAQ